MNEFRSAVRLLVRHLGFSLAVTGTLAVGIASVVTAFNVFDAILLRPLRGLGSWFAWFKRFLISLNKAALRKTTLRLG
jgi:hypothetical protein